MKNRIANFVYRRPWLLRLLKIHSPTGHFTASCWCNYQNCYWTNEPADAACFQLGACGCKVVFPQRYGKGKRK